MRSDKEIQILEAAKRLFAHEGTQAPTARIAREAKVSNGTLFNYFPTKSILFQALYAHLREKISEELGSIPKAELPSKAFFLLQWKAYIKWASIYPIDHQTIQILKKSQMIDQDKVDDEDRIFIQLRQLIDHEIAIGAFKNADTSLILQICISQLDATIMYILKNKLGGDNYSTVVQESFEMLWDGFIKH